VGATAGSGLVWGLGRSFGLDRWLNYHHLYYFYVICAEGGVAKAARKLRLGQPTLSTQLKLIEDALGQKLFDRSKRALTLTEAGKVAFDYAKEIFMLGAEMKEVLADKKGSRKVDVQVGVLDSIPKTLILDLTLAALKTAPCSISLLEGSGDTLFRDLANHKIDLLVADYAPLAVEGASLQTRSIAKVPVAVFGAKQFRHLKKGFPRSLNHQPFVLPTRHSKLRHDFEHYFQQNGLQFDLIAETQDMSLQKLMGSTGVGLIPVPEFAASELLAEKKLFRLGEIKGVHEEFWLVSASRRLQNPVAAALMKHFHL
jgi:LysR family transcriptional regulator, transcriptional activator of nhaA